MPTRMDMPKGYRIFPAQPPEGTKWETAYF